MLETNIAEWTFITESSIPDDVSSILANGETAVAAYRTVRDSAIFTNKRLMVRDVQGITGRKAEIYSVPYSAINMWSTENAGTFDLSAEITLWTRSGKIKINLRKGVDIRKIDKIIAQSVL
ncbi:PH domain-containing protein [Gemella sp. WT2a]|nr:PH domain-containing protein [Gemella sp. WT2a]